MESKRLALIDFLEEQRARLGMTDEVFAEQHLKVRQPRWSQIKNGKVKPSLDFVNLVKDAFPEHLYLICELEREITRRVA